MSRIAQQTTMFEEDALQSLGLNHLHTLVLEPSQLAVVNREIDETNGGHQNLLRELHQQLTGSMLILSERQLRKVYQYAVAGSGGHQDRFKVIVHAAWRSGWVQPD